MNSLSRVVGRRELQNFVLKAVDEQRLPPVATDCFAQIEGQDLDSFSRDADRLMQLKETEGKKNQQKSLVGGLLGGLVTVAAVAGMAVAGTPALIAGLGLGALAGGMVALAAVVSYAGSSEDREEARVIGRLLEQTQSQDWNLADTSARDT